MPFRCIVATAPDALAAERALAEAVAAGACGAEERALEGRIVLWLYAPALRAAEVREAACAVLGEAALTAPLPVEDTDWSEAWKRFLAPVEISPRLRIRSSFERGAPAPGQRELVIDPGQAFGTGAHASTRLALRGLDALHERLGRETRVLDVGTGSGVVALAALRLGAGRALGLDLDPLATEAARANARCNGLAAHLALFQGPLAALSPALRCDIVVANLLASELRPIFAELVSHVQLSGWLVIAGLLESEVDEWLARAAARELALEHRLAETDESGIGWAGLVMRASSGRPRAGR